MQGEQFISFDSKNQINVESKINPKKLWVDQVDN
jgi:hypothetical protein